MKIGKIELSDWKFQHHIVNSPNEWYGWYRNVGVGYNDTSAGIYSSPRHTEWRIHFGGELLFLNSLCNKKIMIASVDEVKNYVDQFLIRISGLKAFA